MEKQGTWASRTQKHSEAGYGQPVDRGAWTAKTVKRPRQQPAHPQCANYWAPLTRKRHIPPHAAQPQHTNYWAPQTRKRHLQEHRPQRPTERSNPTQHAKGRTGDRPGPRKGTTTRRNVTQGGGGFRSSATTAVNGTGPATFVYMGAGVVSCRDLFIVGNCAFPFGEVPPPRFSSRGVKWICVPVSQHPPPPTPLQTPPAPPPGMHWKGGVVPPAPPPGRPAYTQSLSP